MKHIYQNFFEYFGAVAFARFMVWHWAAEKVSKLIKKIFIRTEKDLVIYLHARNKALKKSE